MALQVFTKTPEATREWQWMPHNKSMLSRSARSVLRGWTLALKILGETAKAMRALTAPSLWAQLLEAVGCAEHGGG